MSSDAPAKIVFADNLRGLACLSVLVSHYCGGFWLSRPTVSDLINSPELASQFQTPALVIWINALPQFEWGPFGVGLFFLISGFVIPFSFTRLGRVGFLVARGFRLVPTYIVGFCITILALWSTSVYFERPFPYSASHVAVHLIPGLRDLSWLSQIDAIVWTLEIELKFYFLCAVIAPLLRTTNRWFLIVPAVLAGGAILIDLGNFDWNAADLVGRAALIFETNAPYLIFMFIGVTLNFHYRLAMGPALTASVVAALFLAFVTAGYQTSQLPSYGVALCIFGACYIFRDSFSQRSPFRFFADVSYPLYVVHPILGYALLRVLVDWGLWASVAIAMTTAVAITVSYGLHRIVELPTQKIGRDWGRAISSWLSGRAHSRASESHAEVARGLGDGEVSKKNTTAVRS